MDSLPLELVSEVLLRVPPLDRIRSTLTCRQWAELMKVPALLDDVWLIIRRDQMSAATPIVLRSQRPYPNVRLETARLNNCDPEIWAKLGRNMRTLELLDCIRLEKYFHEIIRHCSKLRSLKILSLLDLDEQLSGDNCTEELRETLSQVTHLHLDGNISKKTFFYLLSLMPNVTSLVATSAENTRTVSLGNISEFLTRNQSISELYLYPTPPLGRSLMEFMETHSERIYGLRLWVTRVSLIEACVAMGDCTKLRRLSVSCCTRFEGHHLEKLCLNAPDLESLNLRYADDLSDQGFAHLLKLKKLQELNIRRCRSLSCDGLSLMGRISSLRHLRLRMITVDVRVLRGIALLEDLRTLIIDSGEIDSECIDIICDNFKKIEKLELGYCEEITDEDVMKLSRLENLRSLKIDVAPLITGRALMNGVGAPTMKFLALSRCSVTDDGLASIAAHHRQLRSLHFIECWHITEPALLSLLRQEVLLIELEVIHCLSLGTHWLKPMTELCPKLCLLEVYDDKLSMYYSVIFRRSRPDVSIRVYPAYEGSFD